jgi:hypothetical protein
MALMKMPLSIFRRGRNGASACAAALAVLASACAPSRPASGKRDVVLLVNADIVTMNPSQPSAEAMAVKGDRIVAIGSEAEVRSAIGSYDRFFDLEGHTVVPGFIETHDHLIMSSNTLAVTDVSPFTTPTLAGALEKIRVTEPDEEGWIMAFGADQTLYKEGKGPTRDLLDPIFPNTPVVVFHISGHGGFVNSEAFRRAGIDKSTANPQGGYFEKDAAGELTGYISGQPALYKVRSFPVPTPEFVKKAAKLRAKHGVTTASEFAVMNAFVLTVGHEDLRWHADAHSERRGPGQPRSSRDILPAGAERHCLGRREGGPCAAPALRPRYQREPARQLSRPSGDPVLRNHRRGPAPAGRHLVVVYRQGIEETAGTRRGL